MARPRKLHWVLYPSFLAVTAFTVLFVGTYTVLSVRGIFLGQTEAGLESSARLVVSLIGTAVESGRTDSVAETVNKIGRYLETRITVVDRNGKVIADTDEDPSRMASHVDRPEIRQALESGIGRAERYSETRRKHMLYIAVVSKGSDGRPVGVVRVALPTREMDSLLEDLALKTALGGILAAALGAFLSWLVSRRVARPVERMASGVKGLIRDDVPASMEEPSIREFATLARVMNKLAAGLRERLSDTTRQQQELEATLSSMSEAVLLIDPDGRIRRINSAGERLLGIESGTAVGRGILDVVSSSGLHDFVAETDAEADTIENDITIEGDKPRFLHAFKTSMRDRSGAFTGTLLVLHDITRLKRLENIRRDFVANVSHELKTPITSIKGFVETLRNDDQLDPETVRRFLEIIARHTDRLNSIIEDLLVLSRIEQEENQKGGDSEDPGIARENVLVSAMIESAVQVCESKASIKEIEIQVNAQPDVAAWINQPLMEQAVVNLVDNAVKYSEQKGRVAVEAVVAGGRLRISVADNGCGIPKEDQSRIFERFYRVDKGRSRAQGGTGLGLSIVRHVATIHGGKVRVFSEPGAGSTFVIDVPAEKTASGRA